MLLCLFSFMMLLHLSCCSCSGLQGSGSKQQQHAAHRGGSNTAGSGHCSGHSPPNPGRCESAVPAQWPSCSLAAHVIQDTWEDHRSACHRLTALWNAETSISCNGSRSLHVACLYSDMPGDWHYVFVHSGHLSGLAKPCGVPSSLPMQCFRSGLYGQSLRGALTASRSTMGVHNMCSACDCVAALRKVIWC